MKKSLLLLIAALMICSSCQKNAPLTTEEILTIENEVKDEFNKMLKTTPQLDFDAWSQFYSKDAFVSQIYSCRGNNLDYDTWMGNVKESFSSRVKHQSEQIEIKVTALGRDHALLTNEAIWENWWKNGTYTKKHGFSSLVWKKEDNTWKIIHVNNGGVVLESTDEEYR